jgi:hypothetical protein
MGNNISKEHINETLGTITNSAIVPTPEDAKRAISIDDNTPYVIADAFNGNPLGLIGMVMEIRKSKGRCPSNIQEDCKKLQFSAEPIPDIKIDDKSIISSPVLRQSIVIDKNIAANVSFFSFLSAQCGANTFFSLNVFDQMSAYASMKDPSWKTGLATWKKDNSELMEDTSICYLLGVYGFVQKFIVSKKFIKYDGQLKGGYTGININGELATSTEEYSLNILYGLNTIIIRRPIELEERLRKLKKFKDYSQPNELGILRPTAAEKIYLSSATGSVWIPPMKSVYKHRF